jgi:hypothetical protein
VLAATDRGFFSLDGERQVRELGVRRPVIPHCGVVSMAVPVTPDAHARLWVELWLPRPGEYVTSLAWKDRAPAGWTASFAQPWRNPDPVLDRAS